MAEIPTTENRRTTVKPTMMTGPGRTENRNTGSSRIMRMKKTMRMIPPIMKKQIQNMAIRMTMKNNFSSDPDF